jgi:hypothetical protein
LGNYSGFIGQLPLDRSMSDSIEIEEIVGGTGKQHLNLDTKVGSDHQMTGVEDAFDTCKGPFDQ